MCGIAGYLELQGASPDEAELETMVSSIAHRGPDGAGLYIEGPVALGHRRLSIIDLEGGAQPMFNEDRKVAVTYNGEIYNFKELRGALQNKGHQFRTASDSEVIVHAWEEWGKACVEKFRGMFAFAVADWKKGCLFLARDQLGIKPLVYSMQGGQFLFASELQALRAVSGFSGEIDLGSLDQFLLLQYIPAPSSIYKDVFKLAPAHRMMVHFDGRVEEPERYYDVCFDPEEGVSEGEWVERLDAAMRESVKAHLVSDVPFGCFLSGGMDSTAIAGLMSEELSSPVKAFSIGFSEKGADEMAYARQAAERFGLEHVIEYVEPHALDVLPDLVRHYGEPFGDSSALPTYYVCRMAREQVPMVLSGDGGDEAMAGYSSYFGWMRWMKQRPYNRPLWKKMLRPVLSSLYPARYAPDPSFKDPNIVKWLAQVNYCWRALREELWQEDYHSVISDEPPAIVEAFSVGQARLHPLNLAQFADYRGYLPNDILAKVDVASMMHGLEVRTPLIDRVFLETVLRIPADVNFSCDASHFSGKKILRGWLLERFPSSFVDRPKQGFSLPLAQWFDPEKGALAGEVKDRLLDSGSPLNGYFNPSAIAGILQDHNKVRNLAPQIWQLLFLDEWMRVGR